VPRDADPAPKSLSRRDLLLASLAAGVAGIASAAQPQRAVPHSTPRLRWRGADISFLPLLEASGAVYRHRSGAPFDALALIRARGINFIRLRLWHTPVGGWCGLAQTIALAQRAKALGLPLLLDIHYSDSWADPGQQTPPAAWSGQSGATLRASVRAYTREVLLAHAAAGVWPAMVQLGNEVTNGMLWPHGRISTAGWGAFASLFSAARDGVADATAFTGLAAPRVLLHTDRGGDNTAARWYLDNAHAQGMNFDVIALSYYPWWHGTLNACLANTADLRTRYGKDVMIVETAYPWTLGWNDNTNNVVGLPGHVLPGFPATPAGQASYLRALEAGLSESGAIGMCYWAPEWTAAPGVGSSWENLAWFGFDGRVL